jgi:hypothetical protein
MSFTNRKPFVVTEEQTKQRWGGGFWCRCCGSKFQAGDTVRWIYANGTKGAGTGNFFVCSACDGEDSEVIERAKESYHLAVKLAKQWDIYGPDWQKDIERQYRREERYSS